jgi:hypothetical protein
MGLVYGRRRQGKTLLLQTLAEAHGGSTSPPCSSPPHKT